MDFCGKLSGFADSEDTVDRGSAKNFAADSGSCLYLDIRILGPKRNLDNKSFFSLAWYVNELIQNISFFRATPSIKLRCETVIGIVVTNHIAFFEINNCIHIYQFTLTFTLLFPDVVVASGLKKNIGGSTDLLKKRHGSADMHTPIHRSHTLRICHTTNCEEKLPFLQTH